MRKAIGMAALVAGLVLALLRPEQQGTAIRHLPAHHREIMVELVQLVILAQVVEVVLLL